MAEMKEMKERYLAILFFNQDYTDTSRFEELPGVEADRIELTELLSEYKQIVIKNVGNVLEELQCLIKAKRRIKFERVHFHFSGYGVHMSHWSGEPTHKGCVVGTNRASTRSRIHDIALELLKLDTDLITMTLDLCMSDICLLLRAKAEALKLKEKEQRELERKYGKKKAKEVAEQNFQERIKDFVRQEYGEERRKEQKARLNQEKLKEAEMKKDQPIDDSAVVITQVEEYENLFIFKAARDTRSVRDNESFTRTLVSVCKEHGGALPILDIEKKVNLKMRDQRCEAVRVLGGNTNWEDFYWPQDVRKLDQEVMEMLQRLDLMEHEEVFKEQDLSISDIAELDHEALKSIGIRLVKHRTAIIRYTSVSSTQSEYEGPQPEEDQQSNLTQRLTVRLPPPSSQSLFPDIGSRTPSAPAYHLVEEQGVDPPAYSSLFPGTSQPQVQPQTGGEARPGEGSSQSSTDSVVLTSTGPSAETVGSYLGVFDYLQEYNKCPAYRQRHSVAKSKARYLYRDEDGDWCVGSRLGNSSSLGLLNTTQIESVPPKNWRYAGGKGKWPKDPELIVSTSLPSVCPVINISLHGAAARAQPGAGGEYRPTGEWSAGHPVFSNGDRYLCVMPGRTAWGVISSPDSVLAELVSGSVTWCPTSPRAALNLNQSSWQYSDSGVWRDGDIRVWREEIFI